MGSNCLFGLLDLNLCLEAELTHDKLSVAKFANLAPWFLTISINFAVRVHSLLIETILTVALSTELAK